ncbi:MAG: hypothetical protein K1X78_28275 [Verrucomicrobiaceae bacterium]|nr:hypothetical protein [Verrucomicrobiaceae bacterium]
MKTHSFLAIITLGLTPGLLATQTINDSLSVTGGLTVGADALFPYPSWFGTIPSQGTAGFVTDVDQGLSTVEREVIIPAQFAPGLIWVDDWDWVTSPSIWIDEWGYYDQNQWVPDQYDGEGNIVEYGHWETVQAWGVTGGYWEQGPSNYQVIGSHQEEGQVWVGETRGTVSEQVFGVPVIRHTAQRHDVVWSWRNLNPATNMTRELMQLSPGGLSLPHPDAADDSARAVLTSTHFEQSYTTPPGAPGAAYQSYGIKLGKDKIDAWWDDGLTVEGGGVTMNVSRSAQYKPEEILMNSTVPVAGGTATQTITTRIAAASSMFGGSIGVNGTITAAQKVRVPPGGDLPMAAEFQNDGGLGVPGAQ